jgi:hypothetical protein
MMASDGGHDGDVEGTADNKLSHDTDSDAPGVSPETSNEAVTYDNLSIRLAQTEPSLQSNVGSCASLAGTGKRHEGQAFDSSHQSQAVKKRRIDAHSLREPARPPPKLNSYDIAVATIQDICGNIMLNALVKITAIFWRGDGWVYEAQFIKDISGASIPCTISTELASLTLREEHLNKVSIRIGTAVWVPEKPKSQVYYLGSYVINWLRLKAGEPGKVEATAPGVGWRDEEDLVVVA